MRRIVMFMSFAACGPSIDPPSTSTGTETGGPVSTSNGSTSDPGASGIVDGSTTTAENSTGTESTTAPGQCDIVVDGPLETNGPTTFSPCYTPDTFSCSTCSEWCETAGLDPCGYVEVVDACPPTEPGTPTAACDTAPTEGHFRCACGAECARGPNFEACLCDGTPSDPALCGCEVEPTPDFRTGVCVCDGGGPSDPAYCDCHADAGLCWCFGVPWDIETCACIEGIEYPPGSPCARAATRTP